MQPGQVLGLEALQLDHFGVDLGGVEAEHECDAAGHACRHVAAGLAQHHDPAAGHVLAGVVADALDDGQRAGVARGEPLAHPAAQVDLAGGGAEQQGVACDHVVLGQEQHVVGRPDDDAATRKALADIVVGVADQLEGDTGRQERADRLARGAGERDVDGVVGQALRAVTPGDLGAEQGADGAVDVAHGQFQPHRMRVLERALGELDQRAVQRLIQAVVLVSQRRRWVSWRRARRWAPRRSGSGPGPCSSSARHPGAVSSISAWPTASSMLRNPSSAR